jgi:4-amino-4-deoxy-L-arabinose transferase-like glycosyltransferase
LWDLEGADEGRYVQVAKELLQRSNWLVLTVGGEPYDQKPPLPFWLMAAALKLSGGQVSAWTVRLPSVLAGIFSVLLVFDIGRARWNPRAGFIAALILLSAPLFARSTPTARLDVIFTAWITLAAWAWLAAPDAQRGSRLSPGRAAIFWIGVLGAFFSKGPLVFVAMFGMLLGESWRTGSWQPWRSVRPLPGLTVLGLLIGGWWGSQVAWAGHDSAISQLAEATWGRLQTGSHVRPLGYYLVAMFTEKFFPWILFTLPAMFTLWKGRREGLPGGMRALLFWLACVLFVLHLSPGKRSYYLLPVFPVLALITGWYIDKVFLQRPVSKPVLLICASLAALMSMAMLASGIAFEIGEDWLYARHFVLRNFQLVVMAVLVLLNLGTLLLLVRSRTPWRAILTLVVVALSAEVFAAGVINTARNRVRSTRSFASIVNALLVPSERSVGVIGKADKPKYHVYGDYQIRPFEFDEPPSDENQSFPRLLIAREDGDDASTVRRSGHYEEIFTLTADEDRLAIFREVLHAKAVHPSATALPLRFAIAGDTGVGPDFSQKRLIEQMVSVHRERPFRAFFLLGDNLYGEDPFHVAMSERFILPFGELLSESVPFYATLGNHDNDHPDRIESELQSPLFNMKGRRYYQESFGDDLMTVFFLNSVTLEEGDPAQLAWFVKALKSSEARWKILVLHHPMLASNLGHGAEADLFNMLRELIAMPGGIDLVLAGHNHFYERRAAVDGVVHITLGAGGKLEADGPFQDDPLRVAGYLDGLSFGWMDVDTEKIRFHAVSEHGETQDRFEIEKPATPGKRNLAHRIPEAYDATVLAFSR